MDELFYDHQNKKLPQETRPERQEYVKQSVNVLTQRRKEEKVYKTADEIKQGLEKLFKLLNQGVVPGDEGEVEYNTDSFIRDTKGLYSQSKTFDYLDTLFDLFWNDSIEHVEKRIPLFKKLVDHNMFDKKDVLKSYNDFMMKAYLYSSDCPKMPHFSAKLY